MAISNRSGSLMPSLPNVFDHLDYRRYLGEWMKAKQAINPKYSHRVFARRAGYKNPSLLGLIVKGQRNLTDALLPGFLATLDLNRDERSYFRTLLELDRATSPEDRTRLVEQLGARRQFLGARRLEDEGFRYISRWYYPAIRELAGRPDFRLDAKWVARRLRPKVSVTRVREALDVLLDIGMIEATPDGGARQTEKAIATAHEVHSLAVHNYHRGMCELALIALEQTDSAERHFGAVTALVAPSLLPKLKQEIGQFQERIANLCDESAESGEIAVQVNLQLFPLSKRDEE